MKFCKDCKFILIWTTLNSPTDYDYYMARCTKTKNEYINMVTGNKEITYNYAQDARNFNNLCGKKGKWFEANNSI